MRHITFGIGDGVDGLLGRSRYKAVAVRGMALH